MKYPLEYMIGSKSGVGRCQESDTRFMMFGRI